MKKRRKLIVCAVVFAVTVGVVGFGALTIDAEGLKPRLVSALSERLGGGVEIAGPVSVSLRFQGFRLILRQVSGPGMRAGEVDLNLGLNVLSGRFFDNITLREASLIAGEAPFSALPGIGRLKIISSQLVFPALQGAALPISVLTLKRSWGDGGLVAKGDLGGAPFTAEMKGGELLVPAPFDISGVWGATQFLAIGSYDRDKGKASISSYRVSAGVSSVEGMAEIDWASARPVIRAVLSGDYVDIRDFFAVSDGDKKEASKTASFAFGDAPLPLKALRAVDADFGASFGALALGKGALERVEARVVLDRGAFKLSSFKALLGVAPALAILTVDAAKSPAVWDIGFAVQDANLGDVLMFFGMPPFMTGKAGAGLRLEGRGDSLHQVASSLAGVMSVAAENGEISVGLPSGIASAIASAFIGVDMRALNCLAARFIVRDGVAQDSGILLDSPASIVSGKARIDFGAEVLDVFLQAKNDRVGTIPLVRVGGGFGDLHISVNPEDILRRFVGSLFMMTTDDPGADVPDMQQPPPGANACVFTLNHPQKKFAPTVLSPSGNFGSTTEKLQDIGNSLINGLFGKWQGAGN